MFLDDINFDELKYLDYMKLISANYFIKFFGEKYKDKILERLDNTKIFFIDRLGVNSDIKINLVANELGAYYCDALHDVFPSLSNKIFKTKDVLQKAPVIMILSFGNRLNNDSKTKLEDAIKFFLEDENYKLNKEDLARCRKVFLKYSSPISTLEKLLNKLENEKDERPNLILDLHQAYNEYIDREYDNLSEKQKTWLSKAINHFYIADNNTAFFGNAFDLKDNQHLEFICYDYMKAVAQDSFLHELLHAISYSPRFYCTNNEKYAFTKHGVNNILKIENQNETIDENRFLNEIFTDYFAVGLKNYMINDDYKLLLDGKSCSTYSLCFVLIKPFIKKYLKQIKECYICEDENMLENFIGIQNLKELNTLVENFAGYADSMISKRYCLAQTFDEGLEFSKQPKNLYEKVVYKYYNSFKKMDNLMKKIEKYIKTNNTENIFV